MKSYHIQYGGGLESLRLREHPVPEPGPTEVLIRIRANSLSARELNILRGRYPLPVADDIIAASDGAGEVVAVGAEVDRFQVGDRVMGVVFPRWFDGRFDLARADQLGGSLDGLLTEYAVLDQDGVLPIPGDLTFEEAATLPCVAVTAWNALVGGQGLVPGESVLTLGSGGVSLFALQLAKLLGARVIATAGSDEKAARLTELGADAVINHRDTPDWSKQVRELTDGRGVDHVVDVAGTLNESLRATATGGEIAFVGSLGGADPVDARLLFTSSVTLRPIALGHRAHFEAMNKAIAASGLRPVIDRVFPFEETPAAFQYYVDGGGFGKIVITQPA
ncbi:zinc-dependent alcohol dehydrogenase family protein [Kribbella jiaozuonensis]|uniref:NAD(P)-dependent alcohol dehydrogenase n=1 Tax=Kribbella jiaozuonensis TaxID=2575441 RepID=A0A4U3LPN5_9ACTN|nr:NAD(P)-dependent alcohol dehydrogenase [Kribbella jiaozuonensis]TKK76297.1 NAD(P)-dependent alcohol dehydrogenase [Kribbella jiaozuonensis]